ncbi:MAG: hypothetical protein AAF327_21140 [Cyanobacteria bacterium P01_A01_bin.37]
MRPINLVIGYSAEIFLVASLTSAQGVVGEITQSCHEHLMRAKWLALIKHTFPNPVPSAARAAQDLEF